MAREYHWMREESIGFKRVWGDRDSGTPRVYEAWIVYDISANPINDPLVKSTWSPRPLIL